MTFILEIDSLFCLYPFSVLVMRKKHLQILTVVLEKMRFTANWDDFFPALYKGSVTGQKQSQGLVHETRVVVK